MDKRIFFKTPQARVLFRAPREEKKEPREIAERLRGVRAVTLGCGDV